MQPTVQVANLPNFRSLPGQSAAKVFRSGALSELTQAGSEQLAGHGIGCVVDLREPYEIAASPDQTHEMRYVNVPLYRGQVPLAAAIDDVYRVLLMERGHQIAMAVQTISQHLDQHVVVHCKAGKDRTGLVVALVLAAVGIAESEIIADYEQSASNLSATYRQHMTQQLEVELADNPTGLQAAMHLHMASPGAAIQRALQLVKTKHGSAAHYLSSHGVTGDDLATLSNHFVSRSAAAW